MSLQRIAKFPRKWIYLQLHLRFTTRAPVHQNFCHVPQDTQYWFKYFTTNIEGMKEVVARVFIDIHFHIQWLYLYLLVFHKDASRQIEK